MTTTGKGVYIHQFNQLGEDTLAELIQTFQDGGIDEVRFKTHQFTTWTGHFDQGGAADIESLAIVGQVCQAFRDAGIRPYPWCVPMGLDLDAEARRAADVALVAGCLDFDVEPYSDFWPAVAVGTYDQVEPFFKRVRQLVGDQVELTLDFPARDSSWEWGRVKEAVRRAAPYMNRLALQSYFGSAQAMDAEHRVRDLIGDTAPIDHIVEPSQFGDLLPWLRSRNAKRVLIWRAADMSPATYQQLKGFAFTGATAPPAPPVVVPPARQFVFGGRVILDAMAARGDAPASDEHYPAGMPSWAVGASGAIYWYTPETNKVAVATP